MNVSNYNINETRKFELLHTLYLLRLRSNPNPQQPVDHYHKFEEEIHISWPHLSSFQTLPASLSNKAGTTRTTSYINVNSVQFLPIHSMAMGKVVDGIRAKT